VNLSPVWTPDGSHLLFISNRDGPRDVYAIAVDRAGRPGGVPERLTTGLGATSISLSADGARVAYSVYTARSNIFALPIVANGVVSGERATPMTTGNQVIESMSVSPDGRWLLYDSDLGGRAHVWRMPIGGGQAEQLTNGPADEFAPDLSPDGRWLAYHSWRTGTRDIEVKAIGGGEPERVTATPAQESYPAWSPDGMSVAFYDQVVPTSIWIVRRDGPGRWSAPRKFAAPASQPAWSPDGASIAYIGAGGNQAGDVFVQAVAGNARREVFHSRPGVLDVTRVAWSHDGRQLFMKVFDQAGRASIWSMSASGGEPRLIARLDDASRSSSRADFAVDATRIYFPLAERQADVFVAGLVQRR
jgi:TolB protein